MKKNQYKDGKRYGYWEYYDSNSKPCFKGNYKNGEQHGYWEYYYYLHPKIKGDNVLIQFYI